METKLPPDFREFLSLLKKHGVEKFDETEDANEIHPLTQFVSSETPEADEESLLSKLQRIRIEGPGDFAANCDAL